MFNARESLNLLMESSALDGLLHEARKHASAVAPEQVSAGETLQLFEDESAELKHASAAAITGLHEVAHERAAQREAKVATVLHILHVGSRLI